MNKVYIVKEIQDYDTSYVIGVCPSLDLANKLKQENDRRWDIEDCEITAEMWDRMLRSLVGTDSEDKSELELLIEMYPEYPVSDIEKAMYEYSHRRYVATEVEEVNLFTNDTDIILYGINSRRAS